MRRRHWFASLGLLLLLVAGLLSGVWLTECSETQRGTTLALDGLLARARTAETIVDQEAIWVQTVISNSGRIQVIDPDEALAEYQEHFRSAVQSTQAFNQLAGDYNQLLMDREREHSRLILFGWLVWHQYPQRLSYKPKPNWPEPTLMPSRRQPQLVDNPRRHPSGGVPFWLPADCWLVL